MLQYIKNILPKLQQFSKDLDLKENFTEKRWVMMDTESNTHEYFFKKDGKLLLFINGDGKQGTWELLDGGKRIMVEVDDEMRLLQSAFIQDGLFVLKKSSSEDLAFALYNPAVITDGDIEKYIENILSSGLTYEGPGKFLNTSQDSDKSLPKLLKLDTDKGKIMIELGRNLYDPSMSDTVKNESGLMAKDGHYFVTSDKTIKRISVYNGKVKSIRYKNDEVLEAIFIVIAIALFIVILVNYFLH
jgi:hypothetical protein